MITGRMDRVVTIQTNTDSQDVDGATTDSWATTYTLWTQRKDFTMLERMQARFPNNNMTQQQIEMLRGMAKMDSSAADTSGQ